MRKATENILDTISIDLGGSPINISPEEQMYMAADHCVPHLNSSEKAYQCIMAIKRDAIGSIAHNTHATTVNHPLHAIIKDRLTKAHEYAKIISPLRDLNKLISEKSLCKSAYLKAIESIINKCNTCGKDGDYIKILKKSIKSKMRAYTTALDELSTNNIPESRLRSMKTELDELCVNALEKMQSDCMTSFHEHSSKTSKGEPQNLSKRILSRQYFKLKYASRITQSKLSRKDFEEELRIPLEPIRPILSEAISAINQPFDVLKGEDESSQHLSRITGTGRVNVSTPDANIHSHLRENKIIFAISNISDASARTKVFRLNELLNQIQKSNPKKIQNKNDDICAEIKDILENLNDPDTIPDPLKQKYKQLKQTDDNFHILTFEDSNNRLTPLDTATSTSALTYGQHHQPFIRQAPRNIATIFSPVYDGLRVFDRHIVELVSQSLESNPDLGVLLSSSFPALKLVYSAQAIQIQGSTLATGFGVSADSGFTVFCHLKFAELIIGQMSAPSKHYILDKVTKNPMTAITFIAMFMLLRHGPALLHHFDMISTSSSPLQQLPFYSDGGAWDIGQMLGLSLILIKGPYVGGATFHEAEIRNLQQKFEKGETLNQSELDKVNLIIKEALRSNSELADTMAAELSNSDVMSQISDIEKQYNDPDMLENMRKQFEKENSKHWKLTNFIIKAATSFAYGVTNFLFIGLGIAASIVKGELLQVVFEALLLLSNLASTLARPFEAFANMVNNFLSVAMPKPISLYLERNPRRKSIVGGLLAVGGAAFLVTMIISAPYVALPLSFAAKVFGIIAVSILYNRTVAKRVRANLHEAVAREVAPTTMLGKFALQTRRLFGKINPFNYTITKLRNSLKRARKMTRSSINRKHNAEHLVNKLLHMQATTKDLDSLQVEFNDDIIDSHIIEQIADKFVSEASAEQIFFAFNNITKLMSQYTTKSKESPSVLNEIKTKALSKIAQQLIASQNPFVIPAILEKLEDSPKQELIDAIAQQLIADPSKIDAVLDNLKDKPEDSPKQELIDAIAQQLIASQNPFVIPAILKKLEDSPKQELIEAIALEITSNQQNMLNKVIQEAGPSGKEIINEVAELIAVLEKSDTKDIKILASVAKELIAAPDNLKAMLDKLNDKPQNKQQSLLDAIAQQLIADPSKIDAVLDKLNDKPENKQQSLLDAIAQQLTADPSKIDAVLSTSNIDPNNKKELVNAIKQEIKNCDDMRMLDNLNNKAQSTILIAKSPNLDLTYSFGLNVDDAKEIISLIKLKSQDTASASTLSATKQVAGPTTTSSSTDTLTGSPKIRLPSADSDDSFVSCDSKRSSSSSSIFFDSTGSVTDTHQPPAAATPQRARSSSI